MANPDQHRTTLRQSSQGYRSIPMSGANSWEDLVACSGTSPGGLKRLTRPEAGSANTVITSPNKLGLSYQPHSAGCVDAGTLWSPRRGDRRELCSLSETECWQRAWKVGNPCVAHFRSGRICGQSTKFFPASGAQHCARSHNGHKKA